MTSTSPDGSSSDSEGLFREFTETDLLLPVCIQHGSM